MRISGIASGFDTEEMVRQLMKVERMKVDRFEQNRQIIQWRQESYNNINKAFANFILNTQKDMGLKKSGSTGSLFDSSYKNADYVKKATSSDENVATVSSTGKAIIGDYEIEIKELAVAAKSASYVSGEIDDSTFKGELTFTINGKSITVGEEPKDGEEPKSISIDSIIRAINSAKVKTVKGEIVGEDYDLTGVDPKDIGETSLGINAFYDKENQKIFMQTTKTGEDAKITVDGPDPFNGRSIDGKDGSGAVIEFNGEILTYATNKFQLNGIDITAKATGTININVSTNTEAVMEKIEKLISDYNNLVDLTSGLVNEKVYSSYKPLSQEERKALSDEDVKLWDEKAKSGLLNRDETLQRTLQSIRNDLYKTVEGLDGDFNHITKIGITTEKYSRGSAGGKLQIDTDKLRAAIEANPDAVMDLLFNEPTANRFTETKPKKEAYENGPVNGQTYEEAVKAYEQLQRAHEKEERERRNAEGGIFTRVYDDLIDGMKNIIDKSGPGEDADLFRGVRSNMLIDFVTKKSSISDLDKSVNEMNRQIDNLNILLAKREETHYAKFTAMEKAMYQMNNQSGWLAQQFG